MAWISDTLWFLGQLGILDMLRNIFLAWAAYATYKRYFAKA